MADEVIAGWYVHAIISFTLVDTNNSSVLDWPFGIIRFDYIEFRILPVAGSPVPRDFECRRSSHWSVHHMCCDLVCMGDRQWSWEPSGKLSSIRLCCLVHLPNLYRL